MFRVAFNRWGTSLCSHTAYRDPYNSSVTEVTGVDLENLLPLSFVPNLDKALPSVVIVGRPNVGKSTLFNAITGQRRSIVGDEPGITRDRIYGKAEYRGRAFEVVDTGGIIPNDEEMIPTEILKQARVALDDASHIVFLIDGRTEITGTDREL